MPALDPAVLLGHAGDDALAQIRLIAALDVLEQCGCRQTDYGTDAAGWWASTYRNGGTARAGEHATAADAFDALLVAALAGRSCGSCRRPVAIGAAPAAGCRWRRFSVRWMPDCIAPVPDPRWRPMEPTTPAPYGLRRWSHLGLADELGAAGADGALVCLVAAGYFHAYRSPLDLPEARLMGALTVAGLAGVAQRVLAGDFTAHPEERLPGQEPLTRWRPAPSTVDTAAAPAG